MFSVGREDCTSEGTLQSATGLQDACDVEKKPGCLGEVSLEETLDLSDSSE